MNEDERESIFVEPFCDFNWKGWLIFIGSTILFLMVAVAGSNWWVSQNYHEPLISLSTAMDFSLPWIVLGALVSFPLGYLAIEKWGMKKK